MTIKNLPTSCLVIATFFYSCSATRLPAKKQVLEPLRLTNQYIMNNWPDPGKTIVTNRERPSNIWTRGVYYEGLMALYNIDKQKKYYDYAVLWGEKLMGHAKWPNYKKCRRSNMWSNLYRFVYD